MYAGKNRQTLVEIASNHGFLILNKDLEDLLDIEDKNRKLLRDIDALYEKLTDNVEDELLSSLWKKLLKK